MPCVDGFVIAVPKASEPRFVDHSRECDSVFPELGATRIVECWEDDVPDGQATDFRRAVRIHPVVTLER